MSFILTNKTDVVLAISSNTVTVDLVRHFSCGHLVRKINRMSDIATVRILIIVELFHERNNCFVTGVQLYQPTSWSVKVKRDENHQRSQQAKACSEQPVKPAFSNGEIAHKK